MIGHGVDEPSVHVCIGTTYFIFWYGSLREWQLGLRDHRENQDSHWAIYFGPFSVQWLA